jgi:hypothetical protein
MDNSYMEKYPCDARIKLILLQRVPPSSYFRLVYHTSLTNPLFFEWDTKCKDVLPQKKMLL